jgi:hypothetical protein
MLLNREALARSLDSLIQMGNQGLDADHVREYVVLYIDTLKYIRMHLEESETLKELYYKFPLIELKEFDKPIDGIMSFVGGLIGSRSRVAAGSSNPRLEKYRQEILEKMPLINTIASEMIMRLGE